MSAAPLPTTPASPASATGAGLYRQSALIFGSSVISAALGLLLSVILARVLGPAEKGTYDLAMAAVLLLDAALGFSLYMGVTYTVARAQGAPRGLLSAISACVLAELALAAGVLALLFRLGAADLLLPSNATLVLSAIVVLLLSVRSAALNWRAILMGAGRAHAASALDVTDRILQVVAITVLLAVSQSVSAQVLLAGTLAAAVASQLLYYFAAARVPPARDAFSFRDVLAYAWPCYAGNLVQFLNYRLDLFLVHAWAGLSSVGIYALAVSLAQLPWLLARSAAGVLMPHVARHQGDPAAATLSAQMARITLTCSALINIVLALTLPPLLPRVFGPAFAEAGPALLWLLPGTTVFALVMVLAAYLAGTGVPRINLYVALAGCTVTVAAGTWLIPLWGIRGAAITSSISYGLSALLTLIVFCCRTRTAFWDVLIPRWRDLQDIRNLQRTAPASGGTPE